MLDEVLLVVARDDCRFGHGEYEPREPQLVRPLAQDVAEHEKSVAAREAYPVHEPAEKPVLSVYVRKDIIHTRIITHSSAKINTPGRSGVRRTLFPALLPRGLCPVYRRFHRFFLRLPNRIFNILWRPEQMQTISSDCEKLVKNIVEIYAELL